MNAEVKEKWIAALRSGKYKQGKKRLRSGDEFCCLGVLCDIIAPEGWDTDKGLTAHLDHLATPGHSILAKAGLYLSQASVLAGFNDMGLSFDFIADRIEKGEM